jgi:hypothetical protein
MARMMVCDQCRDIVEVDIAEQGWYRITNESLELEMWLCSQECIAAKAAEPNVGDVDDNADAEEG